MSQYDSYVRWKNWSIDFTFSEADDLYYSKEFGKIVGQGQRIFEIGFGAGSFLSWARQKGAEVYGVEVQEEIVTVANEKGFIAVTQIDQLLPYRREGFDAAVALDVFEHLSIDEIPNVLASIEKLLKPSGTLTIRVPNGVSPFGRCYQHGDATHLTVITPSKLSQLALATKLRVVDVRNAARTASRKSPAHRLLKLFQFAIRECVNRAVARIYGYSLSTLDQNVVIVLGNTP